MIENNKINLFLLPYAGGSGLYYSHWSKYLNDNITLIPLDLPGRGIKFKEPLPNNLEEAMNSVFDTVKEKFNDLKYGLFGYCIGTTMVYELYKRILASNLSEPDFCVLCANIPPDRQKKDKTLNEKSEEELIEEWLKSSRIKKEDMERRKYLQDMYLTWKADCLMMDKYIFSKPVCKFNCDLVIINGNKDKVFDRKSMIRWMHFTTKKCKEFLVEGDHDFLKTNEKAIIEIINKIIKERYKCKNSLKKN